MDKENLKEKKASYLRTYVEVNMDAIRNNVCNMKKNIAENAQMIGVIKADGYGHGAVPIAHELEAMDFMYGFAVATSEEAHILRMAGIKKPVLILGYTFPYSYEMLVEEEIRTAVFREDSILQLTEAAQKIGKKAKVHIKVDTGMSRIGITPDEKGLEFVKQLMAHEEIEIEGIFTHFAKADEADKTEALKQFEVFEEFIGKIEKMSGLQIPMKHCANSAGIIELPRASMDAVRAGISLYGLYPSEEVNKNIVPMEPALAWYSHIIYIKTLQKGQSVSYGGTFTAREEMKIATIPLGYGDGYPRSLSGKGYVLIHGKKAPILGRVCMDQFMVDVSGISDAKEGDLVTLVGKDGNECISAECLGELSGRFNYELVCDIGKRVPRIYVKGTEIVAAKDYNEDYK